MANSRSRSIESLSRQQPQVGLLKFNHVTGSTALGLYPTGSWNSAASGTVMSLMMSVTASEGIREVARIASGTYRARLEEQWVGVGHIAVSNHYSGVLGGPNQGEVGGAQTFLRPSGSNHTLQPRVPGNWQVTGSSGTPGQTVNFFDIQMFATSGSTEVGSVSRPGDVRDAHEPGPNDFVTVQFWVFNTSK